MLLVCSAAVRAVVVPAIVTLAWLIWGAAPAEASTLDAGPAVIGGTTPAASTSSAVSAHVPAPAASPLRAAPSVPGLPKLKAAVTTTVTAVAGTAAGTADSLSGAANTTLRSVTGTANTVVGEAAAVVTDAAVTPVTETAAPVLAEMHKVIDVVEDAVHSVPPVVSVSGVAPQAVPTPWQPRRGVIVPGADPGTVGTTPVVNSPPANAPEAAADKSHAAPSRGARNQSQGTSLARTADGQQLGASGPSLAQLQMTTPHRPETAGAVQAGPAGLPGAVPHQERLAVLAKGPSGSSASGSEGSGAQAGDLAGSWSGLHLGTGARLHDANQSVPASPTFDPGSSPD